MFFRRDETLQRLLTTPGIPEGDEAVEDEEAAEEHAQDDDAAGLGPAGEAQQLPHRAPPHAEQRTPGSSSGTRVPYLPSWDIARSALWIQLEAGLVQVMALESQAAAVAAAGGGSASHAAAHAAGSKRVGTLQRHAASQLGAVLEGDEEGSAEASEQEVVAAPAIRSRMGAMGISIPVERLESFSATAAVASPPGRCYSRTLSIGRAACAELPHPRGLGDVPLTPCGGGGALGARVGSVTGAAAFGRDSTLLRGRGRSSSIVAAALPAAAADYAAAAAVAGDADSHGGAAAAGCDDHAADEPHHHVAFAVGLAAATTANAAVNSVGDLAVAGLSAVASTALGAVSSAALRQLGPHALAAGSNMLVNRIQSIIVKRTSATAIDAALGAAASARPSASAAGSSEGTAGASGRAGREALNRRLRATMLGMSVMWFLLNLGGMQDSLTHLDFQHDFVHSVKTMIDLASSGPNFMENCHELLQIGFSVGVNLGARNAGGGGGAGGMMAGAATAASAAAGVPVGNLDLVHGMMQGLQAVQNVASGILG
ncbi:hypothetical protein HXX76_002166 [Chlamydomonas incerta]|uniref:Uncharacterized protein n=1 Tax=Chlamydomonas incerta TaxID=51695 RepID=A0A835WAJ4_CHLIN|nr:hypothetical protein HXX76_002166 [Chlamydomonas incerta]|eukprot:KAG2443823.1 hypothetical protein HXX76_002166 [Chlamydomonas incerta]